MAEAIGTSSRWVRVVRLSASPVLLTALACGSGDRAPSAALPDAGAGRDSGSGGGGAGGGANDAGKDAAQGSPEASTGGGGGTGLVEASTPDAGGGRDAAPDGAGGAPDASPGVEAGTGGGDAGTVKPPVVNGVGQSCQVSGAKACAGQAQKFALTCVDGTWTLDAPCAADRNCDSTPGPTAGTCQPILPECSGKASGDVVCAGEDRVACGRDLLTATPVDSCGGTTPACVAGVCVGPRSCGAPTLLCGPDANEDCCASGVVTGGTFLRDYDAVTYVTKDHPATVSSFRLNRFEVTVGRFRRFVAAYDTWRAGGHPLSAEGAHPLIAGTGWDPSWTSALPASAADFATGVQCDASNQAWTNAAGANESRPMNCLTWYEAFAFCAWDGGYLPTQAEWDYAAAGGDEQRAYPWSVPATATTIDDTLAVYCGASCNSTKAVGSRSPLGDGKYGQADLGGNVSEWIFDWAGPLVDPCADCADTVPEFGRAMRGGSFGDSAAQVLVSSASTVPPASRSASVGARCAGRL